MNAKNLSIFETIVDVKLSSGTRYADDRFVKLIDSLTEKDYITYIEDLFKRYGKVGKYTKYCVRDTDTYNNLILGILIYMYQYSNKLTQAKMIFHKITPKNVKFVPSNIIDYDGIDEDPVYENFIVKNIPTLMIELISIIDAEVNGKGYYKNKRISLLATTTALVHLGSTRKSDFIKNRKCISKITNDLTKYLSTMNDLSIDNSCNDDEIDN